MRNVFASAILITVIVLQACDPYKEPYQFPVYHAKGIVIGEEKCSVDSNYNYWLFDLSIENTSNENGDTITYNGVKYNHVFKGLTSNYILHKSDNKVDFDFNFLYKDHTKIQDTTCDAPNTETFLLIGIAPFNVKEIN